MRRILAACAIATALSVAASAQDSTVKSQTKVKTDEASVVSLTGCLQRDVAGHYTLMGTIVAGDNDLTTKSKVKTDVDKDKTKVKSSSKTDVDDGHVATTGTATTFMLVQQSGTPLTQFVGQNVQISAVIVDPDHKDADVKVDDKTNVDPERGKDSTSRSKTKLEIDRGIPGQYNVVSVKPLGGRCSS